MKPLTLEWVEKAEGDYATALRELRVRKSPNYDAVCFHAQQCAEKYLKARLQEAETPFGKTHNLVALLNHLIRVEPYLEEMRQILTALNEYAVEFRYPGDSADKELAKEAFNKCERVRKLFRERVVCDAAIDIMSKREKTKITFLSSPDKSIRKEKTLEKAPDYIYRDSHGEIVVEHTRIESFSGQIEGGQKFVNLLLPLEKELDGKLPSLGSYMLMVDTNDLKKVKRKNEKKVREAIKIWVLDKAPTLEIESHGKEPKHFIKETPKGIPFETSLYRHQGRDGKFLILGNLPNDLEKKRRDRINEALNKKLPKLAKFRGNKRRSLLVLESDDIAQANFVDTGMALAGELSKRSQYMPDYVYLVETEIFPWDVIVLKERKKFYPNIQNPGPHPVTSSNPGTRGDSL